MRRYFRVFYTIYFTNKTVECEMPLADFPTVLKIKDPIHGYISLTELEKEIVDLRLSQRLRYIQGPAGLSLVYPGAAISLLGRTFGFMHMTEVFLEYLGGEVDEVLKGRLASLLLMLTNGPWANVSEEYMSVRGVTRPRIAKIIVEQSEFGDLVEKHGFTKSDVVDLINKGIPIKGLYLDLMHCPINPELIDDLERDSYFAGVEYAQLEFRRLFSATRIAKNKIAVERGSLFTLESYLSAAANMFEAVYFHKTVRAAELMLLRVLDEAGAQLFCLPTEDSDSFLMCDDLSFLHRLLQANPDDSEEIRNAQRIFDDFSKRKLVKLVSSRAISDPVFLNRLTTADGLYGLEKEIADDAGIDSSNVYIDFPDRASVTFYPERFGLDDLVLFERGSSGYEFWLATDLSPMARSFSRILKPVRVYTTRGYRTKLKKSADRVLESVDSAGSK
jgi:HD superfamily phosphohydrolase